MHKNILQLFHCCCELRKPFICLSKRPHSTVCASTTNERNRIVCVGSTNSETFHYSWYSSEHLIMEGYRRVTRYGHSRRIAVMRAGTAYQQERQSALLTYRLVVRPGPFTKATVELSGSGLLRKFTVIVPYHRSSPAFENYHVVVTDFVGSVC